MTLEQTRHRREAVDTIHDIVGAMRAISAGRIQRAQRALAAARRYEAVVLRSIGALAAGSAARSLPATNGRPPLLIVFTSEQPLCGAFNQNVLDLAERRWDELRRQGPVHLLVIGQRGLRQFARRRIVPELTEPAATTIPGLRDLVKRVAQMIDARYAARQIGALHVVYNRYQSVSEQVPTEEQLLPVDLDQCRSSAAASSPAFYHYLPSDEILAGLISEYAFIGLYRLAAESYASEQASRLVAMDGATRNTDKIAHQLLDLERRERQGQITRQVLELIAARFATD